MNSPSVLTFEGVSYRYPDGSRGLEGCSLSLRQGSRTVVLGPNGAGKTTFFLHCNGLIRPSAGRVLMGGVPLDYGRAALCQLRSRVGLVFQNPDAQLFSASVREDVSFGPVNLGLDRSTVKARVEEALEAVGMAAFADKPVHNLSYGQKKRVCIAGVLAMRPSVMILDEPTAGLDVRMQQDLLAVLERLHAEGMTIVMATHDMDLAYAWAEEVCILDQGALATQCPVEAFPDQAELLERLGFGIPHVARLHRQLAARGVLMGSDVPRDFEGLSRLLEEMSAF
ncbi:MAG: cobalt transporter ATP-binding protein [Holophagaceae bacterium]|nr:cobalt transporter ATP-binding protein [Holophagaceae bacterium]